VIAGVSLLSVPANARMRSPASPGCALPLSSLFDPVMIPSLVHFHLTSSGLRGILSWLEAAGQPFFLDPLEGTETS
jgi:hypothetical protein